MVNLDVDLPIHRGVVVSGPCQVRHHSDLGPTAWPWGTRHRGADDATYTESDDQHAGNDSAQNVGKEAHEKQDGVEYEKPMRGSPRHGHGRRLNP